MVHGWIEAGLLDAEPRRRVALGIEVYKEGRAVSEREARGKVDGSRRLPNPALLIYNGKNPAYRVLPSGELLFHDEHIYTHVLSSRVNRVFHAQHSGSAR
jgi:hypothetical protein